MSAERYPSTGGSAAAAELVRVGRRARGGGGAGDRRAERDPHAHLPEPRVEDVGAVRRAGHPAGDDLAGRGERAGAPGEVLADLPAAGLREVAGVVLDALGERLAAGGHVREE